jgi:arginine:agmatine antiporter
LAASNAPFADAARDILGSAADWLISFCAAAACLGALGGWIMATALSAKAAADDGLFPAVFKKANAKGAPVQGLLIVGVLMSLVLLGTVSPAATMEFASIASIAVLLVLVAYLYVIAACLSYRKGYMISIVAMLFCGWAVWSTKHQEATWLAILLLVSVSLYAVSRKNEPRT